MDRNLRNRKQRVEINGVYSAWHKVPQGSILGPLLLIIYKNDIVDNISGSEIYLYADDAKVL